MSTTPNLGLQEMPQNSLQPSVPYNSSMQLLDVLCQLVIQDKDLTAPPVTTDANIGEVWIVGAASTGAWNGKDGQLAVCTAATLWQFLPPKAGWRGYMLDETKDYRYSGSAWVALT